MRTSDFDFSLPEDRIAIAPAQPRDAARLMVVSRAGGAVLDRRIEDLPELLDAGDLLIANDSRVHAARLLGAKVDGGGRVEGLFVAEPQRGVWRMLLRGGRLRDGTRVRFDRDGAGWLEVELVGRSGPAWLVQPRETADGPVEAGTSADALLDAVGHTPLPPYILAARREAGVDVPDDRDRCDYATIFSGRGPLGSVAAPTAGLHFTPDLLARLDAGGITRATITLHVGEGTFRPVTADTLDEHEMHAERYRVPAAAIDHLRGRAGGNGTRVIAVGTTTVRTLESLPDPLPEGDRDLDGETSLMIAPGHAFRHVDGLLTNFHLPRSTLLALVSALLGRERTLELYRRAVDGGYRFYSYGDAMLILP